MTWEKLVVYANRPFPNDEWTSYREDDVRSDLRYSNTKRLGHASNPWYLIVDDIDVKVMMNDQCVIIYRRKEDST